MSPVIAAAHRLCNILEAENTALTDMNIPAATALVAAKQSALEALLAEQAGAALPEGLLAREAAERLRALATANKALLERALLVQDRILAGIARAIARASAQGGRYGPHGASVAPRALPPVALSARA